MVFLTNLFRREKSYRPFLIFMSVGLWRENIITMKPEKLFPSNPMEVDTMNDTQRQQIEKLRAEGLSYGKISETLGLSINTIKTYCRRHGLGGVVATSAPIDEAGHFCLCCGKPVQQTPGRKEKKFCSDSCRNKWWNSHLDKVERKANYEFVCPHCKKPFTAYGNKNRKYCSHECYIADRFGGGSND